MVTALTDCLAALVPILAGHIADAGIDAVLVVAEAVSILRRRALNKTRLGQPA